MREIIEIEGFEKDDFKTQNINLLFGVVNDVEYCTTMFNFPELRDIPALLIEKNIPVTNTAA